VGRAGKFLNQVLAENCIDREEVFVTNVVKHITPENREPFSDEVEACLPYLQTQLQVVKPKTVVLMGTVAWRTPRIASVEYVEMVHPSAAMRFPRMRKRFLEDFRRLSHGNESGCVRKGL
jgi:DNA polymerase